jgi:hypothetical protein
MKLTKREQIQGPARSFFQFEAPRAKDAGLYAKQKKYLDDLAAVSGESEDQLSVAVSALPDKDSSFPDDNLIHTLLKAADLFGCYLARIAFKKVTAVIPASNSGHAQYWYTYWKVTGGNEEKLKKIFEQEAAEVDRLLSGATHYSPLRGIVVDDR